VPALPAADGLQPGRQPGTGAAPVGTVEHVPGTVDSMYLEARKAISAGADTACVMACRKLLMNIAVSMGPRR
jgi:hypothetical protein